MLFDLDGVLIDSEGEYSKFWSSTADAYGLEGEAFAARIKGTTLGEILTSFPPEARPGIVESLHKFESEMQYPYMPGVEKFLERLTRENIPAAIVTSSDDTKMRYLYARHPALPGMMAAIVTGSDVTHSKPDPEGYLRAAELLGMDPADCYVFEDSLQGLEAGRRSGAKVIGLATTNPRQSVEPLADITADSFEELLDMEF